MGFNSEFFENIEVMFKEKIEKHWIQLRFGTCPSDFSIATCDQHHLDCIRCESAIRIKASSQD